ncbi:hypothetical protein B0H10DRAFT_1964570 [Mycena sp. CBHHK59/15]|nr:hypothetical protein B0H10DRAFT_1964570 [Mycena sp. CBHHK59/15]
MISWNREWQERVWQLIHHPDTPISCLDLLDQLRNTHIDGLCDRCQDLTVRWIWGKSLLTQEEGLVDEAIEALMALQTGEPIRAALSASIAAGQTFKAGDRDLMIHVTTTVLSLAAALVFASVSRSWSHSTAGCLCPLSGTPQPSGVLQATWTYLLSGRAISKTPDSENLASLRDSSDDTGREMNEVTSYLASSPGTWPPQTEEVRTAELVAGFRKDFADRRGCPPDAALARRSRALHAQRGTMTRLVRLSPTGPYPELTLSRPVAIETRAYHVRPIQEHGTVLGLALSPLEAEKVDTRHSRSLAQTHKDWGTVANVRLVRCCLITQKCPSLLPRQQRALNVRANARHVARKHVIMMCASCSKGAKAKISQVRKVESSAILVATVQSSAITKKVA